MTQTAKLLYALLLDRATLSQSNDWQDEDGRIYLVFYDRLLEMCVPILFTGTNFRRQTAQNKLDKLKAMMKEKCL